jgi:hypothetical protein
MFRMRTSEAFATWRVCLSRVIASSVRPAAKYAPDPRRRPDVGGVPVLHRGPDPPDCAGVRAEGDGNGVGGEVDSADLLALLIVKVRAREIREALAAQVIRKHPRRV